MWPLVSHRGLRALHSSRVTKATVIIWPERESTTLVSAKIMKCYIFYNEGCASAFMSFLSFSFIFTKNKLDLA